MRLAWLVLLAGCHGGYSYELTVSTSFTVTTVAGTGTSPLDPIAGQVVDISIAWPQVDSNRGDVPGCKTTGVGFTPSERAAFGATEAVVRTEILDRLPDWDVRMQICDAGAGRSSIVLESVINELNLSFGCFGVPASALHTDGEGYPMVTSFTATECSATILDVVNARVFGNPSFAMTFETGPDHVP